ncbi:MAG: DUF493 domain-containing protein [Spirochaetales bacterium]|nr:DUF493 domain-containing protein [Spirochaetales bacterium]
MKENKLEYPRVWRYKVFGVQKEDMVRDIGLIMAGREFSLQDSKSNGKFLSLELMLTIGSEAERNSLFGALKGSDSIRMVL